MAGHRLAAVDHPFHLVERIAVTVPPSEAGEIRGGDVQRRG
jgi:hypothetical protein